MIDREKLQAALQFAKDNGLQMIEVDGVKLVVPMEPDIEMASSGLTDDELLKEDDSLGYSDEEILYWSTPYFDELQDMKKKRQELAQLQEEVDGNGD